MTGQSQSDLIRKLKPWRIIFPVILGLAVVGWLILKELDSDIFNQINFTWKSVFWLFVAWCCMLFRDLGYIIRIRVLTDKEITFLQAFRIIMLWEFTSAITPSTVGGTAVAVVFLHKEGITVGKSTSVVLATSFLDELYFVIMLPLLLLLVGGKALFTTTLQGTGPSFLNELVLFTIIGYTVIFAWVLLVGYGLFLNPEGIRKLIVNLFRLPFIRRWRESAIKAGDDIVESSHQLKKRSLSFWIKASTATFLSWTARYWVVNAILMAFFAINEHFLIFARQLVTWIMMIISPTPGGSGFAELILSRYISDLIPVNAILVGGVAIAMAIIWRLISYYPYLVIGTIIIPRWIDRKFISTKVKKQ